MKIGLIDVDGHNFPNIPLMKLSSYHKSIGDTVEWYDPLLGGHYDKVYMAKVFSFTPDYEYPINADVVVRGGTGYHIKMKDGKEKLIGDEPLPYEVEHQYPDYDLYGITDTAYGFLTRGCPRGCDFCHVKDKEGRKSIKVADLSEFWNGQKKINLCDANFFACKEWKDLSQQLIDSGSYIDFNQGIDVRLLTDEKIDYIMKMKIDRIHFAWDRYEDKDIVFPAIKHFSEYTKWKYYRISCFVLCNYNTTFDQDVERVEMLKPYCNPYVMLYDKTHIPPGHRLKKLQQYCNNRFMFRACNSFYEFDGNKRGK